MKESTKGLLKTWSLGAGIVVAAVSVLAYFYPHESQPTQSTKGDHNVSIQGSGNRLEIAPPAGNLKRSEVNDSLLPGIWFAEYSYSGSRGSLTKVRGTAEYFENGSYSFRGQQTELSADEGHKYELTYGLIFAGEWEVSGRNLLIKTVEVNAPVHSINKDSRPVDISGIPQSEIRKIIPNLEDKIPKGMPERFEIVQLEKDRMRLRGLDLVGGFFEFDATKQATRFVRK